MKQPRITCWDIEASNLNADFGVVLCVGFKCSDERKAKVFHVLEYAPMTKRGVDILAGERELLKAVSEELLSADMWVTHYGMGYDLPFINSRLLYHKLPTLPFDHPHVDTWKVARGTRRGNGLKLRNNRLNTISEFLRTDEEKDRIQPEEWLRTLGGDKTAMKTIVEHCRRDVVVLEEVYTILRPLMSNHPNLNRDGECSVCGQGPLHRRGYRVTRTRRYPRYQCQACGSWLTGKTFESLPGPRSTP